MVHQPPAGTRDLLPQDVTQKRWIESRLQQVFQQWGYQRIITPTLERLDTLAAGGAVQRSAVIQVQSDEESGLGLRPELTASIARAAVTRLAGSSLPLRLYYLANVFRPAFQGDRLQQRELFQAGVELLGVGGTLADAEVLHVLADALAELGFGQPPLGSWHLVVGEASLTRSLLQPFPKDLREKVRQAIAQLDRVTLESLPLESQLRDRALLLHDLRGQPDQVFAKLQQLTLTPLEQTLRDRLAQLVELYNASAGPQDSPLLLDLSLLRSFDYYTGIVFEVVYETPTGPWVLAQGGRYDRLLDVYDPQAAGQPGIGFSCNIENLQQVLLAANRLPHRPPAIDQLVIPVDSEAYGAALAEAQRLQRQDQLRVELYLDSDRRPEVVQAFAQRRRIGRIVWVSSGSAPQSEAVAVAERATTTC